MLSLSSTPDMEWWNKNRKIPIKMRTWKRDEGENHTHWSLSILMFCWAGIWSFLGTSGCSLIILYIWSLKEFSLPITFQEHVRSQRCEICLPENIPGFRADFLYKQIWGIVRYTELQITQDVLSVWLCVCAKVWMFVSPHIHMLKSQCPRW